MDHGSILPARADPRRRANLPGSNGPFRAGILRIAYYSESPTFRGERFRGRPISWPTDHPTEAACLLEQGASYHRRIGLENAPRRAIRSSPASSTGAFSLYFGDAPIYHFDLEGRWQRAFVDGTHYLKGLDATVHAIDRVREGPNLILKRRNLSYAEAADFDAVVRSTAIELLRTLRRGTPGPSRAHVAQGAGRLNLTNSAISSIESARGIPPRGSLIANAICPPTAHCRSCRPNARTRSFCKRPWAMPRESPSAVGLRASLIRVQSLSLSGTPRMSPDSGGGGCCRAGSCSWRVADVLHQPGEEVAGYLSAVGSTFPIESRKPGTRSSLADVQEEPHFDGVHAFLDHFSLSLPDRIGWHELATRGLVRISLGVESGDPDVRQSVSKTLGR